MTKKTNMYWLVFLAILIFSGNVALYAVCGSETRETLDSLKCEDLQDDTSYTINVNVMCGTLQGVEQTAIQLEEVRPNIKNIQKTIFESQVKGMVFKEKTKAEFQLFSQRAGKNGTLEAFAIPNKNVDSINQIRLHIVPNGGGECAKTVDVSKVWGTKTPMPQPQ